jgi:hypothetical protein
MIDGAALGTVMIGLDHVRTSAEQPDPPARPVGRVRHGIAAALRFVADRIDRRRAGSSAPASPAAA